MDTRTSERIPRVTLTDRMTDGGGRGTVRRRSR